MDDLDSLTTEPEERMPGSLVLLPILYIVALIITAIVFRNLDTVKVLGLAIPTSVVWFGTLGGVVASLQGMFFHNHSWDPRYTIWHAFAGIIGAAFGLASFLFLVVIVKSAAGSNSSIDAPVFALGAFALGYGQSKFHSMMDQVFSILFQATKPPKNGAKKA